MSSISGVHKPNPETHDWITPRHVIDAVGPFDLDVCQSVTQPWPCADRGIVWPEDGLSAIWHGRVWCNPPYSVHAAKWLEKMAVYGDGIALIFARTETAMFHRYVWGAASAVLFLKGRLTFHYPDGQKARANSGGPSCLIAYGARNVDSLVSCGLSGYLVRL